jgi:O-antigen ligase
VLILSPLRVLIATEADFQLPVDIGQLGLVVMLLVVILHRTPLRIKEYIHQSPALFLILGLFLITLAVNLFVAGSLNAWFGETLKWIQIIVIVVLVIALCQRVHWGWLLAALMVASTANGLVGIYQYLGGSGSLHLVVNQHFFRAFGTFGQPNPFGGFMGITIPLTAAMLVANLSIIKNYLAFKYKPLKVVILSTLLITLALVLMLTAIVMSWSRGAWLGILIAFAMMAIAAPRNVWKGVGLGALMLGLVGLLWISDLIPASVAERVSSSADEFFSIQDVRGIQINPTNYAVVERLAHWQAALNMSRANPWLGVGFGNYEGEYQNFRLINWLEPLGHAHNYYLNILAELGLIGLLVYSKVWFILFTKSWQARLHPDPLARAIAIGILGTWTYFSVHSLFDNLYVNNLFLHIGVLIGVLVVVCRQAERRLEVHSQ